MTSRHTFELSRIGEYSSADEVDAMGSSSVHHHQFTIKRFDGARALYALFQREGQRRVPLEATWESYFAYRLASDPPFAAALLGAYEANEMSAEVRPFLFAIEGMPAVFEFVKTEGITTVGRTLHFTAEEGAFVAVQVHGDVRIPCDPWWEETLNAVRERVESEVLQTLWTSDQREEVPLRGVLGRFAALYASQTLTFARARVRSTET